MPSVGEFQFERLQYQTYQHILVITSEETTPCAKFHI